MAKKNTVEQPTKGYLKLETALLGMFLALIVGLLAGSFIPELLLDSPKQQKVTQSQQKLNLERPQEVTNAQIQSLEQQVAKNPKDQALWIQLGNSYYDAKLAPQAIEAYEMARTLGAANADLLTDLGNMYRQVGNYTQAIDFYQKAQALDPKHTQSLLNEGIVLYYDLKQKPQALAIWQKLLLAAPNMTLPDGTSLAQLIKELEQTPN
ncbi:MAG: tetratricopeptide repeat protein [Desulfovibrionaceae bacterium]|nr:tetratricopeptide repeat protein [Desulfovibrionaceae bacterium]